jgi:hypothetical protein
MIDRIFSALLTFCILAGGTVAIGSAMLEYDTKAAHQVTAVQREVVQLPAVEVVVKRPVLAQTERTEPRAGSVQ